MSSFFVMEAANLFCGDHDPNNSKHLTLTELKLPELTEEYAEHKAGGSPVAIEVALGVAKLEPTFKLNGFDPDLLTQFGLGSKVRNMFTAYGVLADKRTGKKIESKAIIEARLGSIAQDAFQKGELQSGEYKLNEVVHYELWFNGLEKIYFDFFANTWRVNGKDENAEFNRILRIPGSG